jgi:Ca2+-binding EF-hand superfamily protein
MHNRIALLAAAAVIGGGVGFAAIAQDEAPIGPPGGMMDGPMSFATLDANKDGKITPDEVQAARQASVAGVDANGDGKISEDEMIAWQVAKATARATERAKARFAAQDINGDGQLTVEELLVRPMPAAIFVWVDTNGDGVVTEEEFNAMHQRMQDRMEKMGGDGPRGGMGMMHGDGPRGHRWFPMMGDGD